MRTTFLEKRKKQDISWIYCIAASLLLFPKVEKCLEEKRKHPFRLLSKKPSHFEELLSLCVIVLSVGYFIIDFAKEFFAVEKPLDQKKEIAF